MQGLPPDADIASEEGEVVRRGVELLCKVVEVRDQQTPVFLFSKSNTTLLGHCNPTNVILSL